jgi:hypothetical protein
MTEDTEARRKRLIEELFGTNALDALLREAEDKEQALRDAINAYEPPAAPAPPRLGWLMVHDYEGQPFITFTDERAVAERGAAAGRDVIEVDRS